MTPQLWPATLPARQVRIARPTDRLDEVVEFYRDGLGLPELERFTGHAGYRGLLLGLPGRDHHLEFTEYDAGSPGDAPSRDHLLVLSFDGSAAVRAVAARLADRGHPAVAPENPYWAARGAVTVEDPDRWRLVLMPEPLAHRPVPNPLAAVAEVGIYRGDRAALRPLFALAEDSPTAVDAYLGDGRILVIRSGGEVVGHIQLVDTGRPAEAELKNMAVRTELQGRGLGGRLVRAALDLLAVEGTRVLHVATAAADIENLCFYQRHGFRMRSVERDAFTPDTGYPADTTIGGIPLRDRVWLDRPLDPGEDTDDAVGATGPAAPRRSTARPASRRPRTDHPG